MSHHKNNKLNIALVNDPVGKTGTEVLTKYIQILETLCDNLFVITGNFPENRFSSEKIHIRNIKSYEKEHESTPSSMLKFLIRELKILFSFIKIARNVDIVISRSWLLLMTILAAKILRKRVIRIADASLTEQSKLRHGSKSPLYYLSALGERMGYVLSNQIVTHAISDLMDLNRYKRKVLWGAPFVDTTLFNVGKDLEQRPNMVGYIGNLSEVKGVMNLINAIPMISSECNDVRYLIGGDGVLREKIEEELQRKQLTSKVILTGWIPYNKLPGYLNDLKLLILPSHTEALPNMVLEAMACGTPVLTTPVGCIPEVVKDSDTGFLMEDNTPEAIARNVIRALNHPHIKEIADNERKLIEERYTYQAAVERYGIILHDARK